MKLLQKIIPAILIFSYLVITNQSTIAYLYFKIDQNYIAKNLCVQKDAAENLCLGNCYLEAIQKRLAEDSKKHDQTSTPVKYSSSNPIQEYVTIDSFNIFKKEFFVILSDNKIFKLLTKNYSPLTPPPKILS